VVEAEVLWQVSKYLDDLGVATAMRPTAATRWRPPVTTWPPNGRSVPWSESVAVWRES
jgi:hypothetical protein